MADGLVEFVWVIWLVSLFGFAVSVLVGGVCWIKFSV